MPCVKPVTLTGEDDADALIEPGDETAVNEDASPPPAAGVNATSTEPLPCATLVPTSSGVPIVADKGITPNCDHPAEVYTSIYPVCVFE